MQIKRRLFWTVIIFFGIIYCCISLVNHYNFRTYAWDLGINNNAVYDYAHFRWNDCMLMQPQYKNILSDHFTLYPILISPFYWLFGSYTLLLFQIVAILFGGAGIYRYFSLYNTKHDHLPLLAMIHFLSVWGIYSALSFDYHDNVVSAMLVPWLFYYHRQLKLKAFYLLVLLICIGKENMALWMVFISAGLILLHRSDKNFRNPAIVSALFSLVYFIVITKSVIPALANAGREYNHFKYSAIGKNFAEAIQTALTNPGYVFSLFFENKLPDARWDGIKEELHFFVAISGGFILLLRPAFLIMLLPIYAQKLLHNEFGKWGINAHYSIEFVPIITLALFGWISRLKHKQAFFTGLFMCLLTFGATISSIDHRVSKWYFPRQLRFYQVKHYTTPYSVKSAMTGIGLIPDSATVSASSQLVPHLAFRDYIYQFPDGMNADYIAILKAGNPFPLTHEGFSEKMDVLNHSEKYKIIYQRDSTVIYQRIKGR
jgi:uncharacterized membrane protein